MLEVMKYMENTEIYSDRVTLLNLLDVGRFFYLISYLQFPHTILVFTVYSKDLVLFVLSKYQAWGQGRIVGELKVRTFLLAISM